MHSNTEDLETGALTPALKTGATRKVEDISGVECLIDPLSDPRWARFVRNEPRASVFHSLPWLRSIRNTYGYEPIVYTSAREQEELSNGLLFFRVKSWLTGHRLVSLPFSDYCEPLVSGLPEFRQLLSAPESELANGKWKYIEVRPKSPLFAADIEEHTDEYFLHHLNLQPQLDVIYKGLHAGSIRRKILRAEREGLVLESGNSERLLGEFVRLHLTTRRRHQLPPHPRKWFRHLLECFKDAAIIRIAKRQGSAIAAVLTIESGKSLAYKYGCSEARFHNTGAMPFVFWDMIRDAKLRGFDSIDLGRTDRDNIGLITFKERWGATRERLVYARYPPRTASEAARERRLMRLAKAAFSRCPAPLLSAAGRALYPHIG